MNKFERLVIIDYFGLRKEIYVTINGDFRNIPREVRHRLYPRLDMSRMNEEYQVPTKETFSFKDITFYFEGEMAPRPVEDIESIRNGYGIPIYRAKEF